MSTNKKKKSGVRSDKGKWFFVSDEKDKIFIKKTSGRAPCDDNEVSHIQASATKAEILKVNRDLYDV